MKDKEKIALFIDADNAPAAKIDIILSELARYGVVNIRKAYGNWKSPGIKPWEDVLHEFAIQPIQQFDLTKGKNATDIALDSTFKTKMPDNVRFARGGIEYIKSKRDIAFSEDEVANIIEQIESGRLERSFKTNRQHVKHVKEIIKEKSDTKSCSRCNSDMVLRKAVKGKNAGNEFWGCSAFPKCKNVV